MGQRERAMLNAKQHYVKCMNLLHAPSFADAPILVDRSKWGNAINVQIHTVLTVYPEAQNTRMICAEIQEHEF